MPGITDIRSQKWAESLPLTSRYRPSRPPPAAVALFLNLGLVPFGSWRVGRGDWREQDRKEDTMRSLITAAALLVTATLTMGFTAESFQAPSVRTSEPATPPANNENGSDGKGVTVEQENAIPYRP